MEKTLSGLIELGLKGDSLVKLSALLERKDIPKGHLLIQEGKIERYLYFLESGIARTYCNQSDREVTICFNEAGSILLSLNSYSENRPGYESIDLLESSVVYRISHEVLKSLFETEIDIANWGRKLAELEFLKADKRFMSQRFFTATQRYEAFIEEYPDLFKRIQLGHIASYLGISQVTLSRIRGNYAR